MIPFNMTHLLLDGRKGFSSQGVLMTVTVSTKEQPENSRKVYFIDHLCVKEQNHLANCTLRKF